MGQKQGPKRQIEFVENGITDAFHRLRTSAPVDIFDSKKLFNKHPNIWEDLTNGAGASIAHLPNEASIRLRVGTVSGEYAIRQTRTYFSYIPGKSQYIALTGIVGTGKSNVTKRLGYYDHFNGLFFEQEGTTFKIVRRTKTSGSVVDSEAVQADWNIDKFDGSGPSGITLDLSKTQIFVIDFQWLGVGRVRFGIDIGGKVQYCHEIINSNEQTTVYMQSPTLPLRYEIINTGTAASQTDLIEICGSVTSEGGTIRPALQFSTGLGTSATSVTSRQPLMAVRLTDAMDGLPNRKTGVFLSANAYAVTNAGFVEVAHINDPTNITSATWTLVASGSAIEYSTDISSVTGNDEHVLTSFYVAVAGAGATKQGANERNSGIINQQSIISQTMSSDNSQMFVVYGSAITGTSNMSVNMDWLELD
jgi:hypothetical protein